MPTENSRIIMRRGTTAEWLMQAHSVVLALGEPAVEYTTSGQILLKIGDGQSLWADLPYFTTGRAGGSSLPSIRDVLIQTAERPSTGVEGQSPAMLGARILLDCPAPANCFLQYHRRSKRIRSRASTTNRNRKSFRPILVYPTFAEHTQHCNPVFYTPIPEGATHVDTSPLYSLFRHAYKLRSNRKGKQTPLGASVGGVHTNYPLSPGNVIGFRSMYPRSGQPAGRERWFNFSYDPSCPSHVDYKFSCCVLDASQRGTPNYFTGGEVSPHTLRIAVKLMLRESNFAGWEAGSEAFTLNWTSSLNDACVVVLDVY